MSTIRAKRDIALSQGLNGATLLPSGLGWQTPTGDDVRVIIDMCGMSSLEVAVLLGVDARNVRRWKCEQTKITYAAWCLLVNAAGLGYIPNFRPSEL